MLSYPEISPVLVDLGVTQIRWYGVMYALGLAGVFFYLMWKKDEYKWTKEEVVDIIFYSALGIIFGGRVGYIFLYQFSDFIANPLTVLMFCKPGRSFHGGFLGVLLGVWVFCKVYKRRFLEVTDFIVPAIPFAIFFGRIGNFLNGELWGRVTDVPWGMVFPMVDNLVRHPSQIYEAILEGIVLGLVLVKLSNNKKLLTGTLSFTFLFGYGVARFICEFFREPDFDQGFVVSFLTKGHILSIPMILIGIAWFAKMYRGTR